MSYALGELNSNFVFLMRVTDGHTELKFGKNETIIPHTGFVGSSQ